MQYTTTRTQAPGLEPVSLSEIKVHGRVSHADEDLFILKLLRTATQSVEQFLARSLITQKWEMAIDDCYFPQTIELPWPPLISVEAVKTYDTAETESVFSTSSYVVDTKASRIYLKQSVSWPSSLRPYRSMVIEYTTGYGPARENVPEAIRHATCLLTAHLYENREATARSEIGQSGLTEIPYGVKDMLYPFKVVSV